MTRLNDQEKKFLLRKKNTLLANEVLSELFPNPKISLNFSNNWELLVAVILSAQCTDKCVNQVTSKLFEKYQSLEDYVKADTTSFEKDIRLIGFYRSKTKHILQSAKILRAKFKSKIPNKMKELITLPGVGRKTANVVLTQAFGITEGIAVDTHVKRIAKIYGLTESADPVKVELELMILLPKSEWSKFTLRIINYGRKFCPARKHDHENCPIFLRLKQ